MPGIYDLDMRFELALRGLGRRDPVVAKMLVEVDAARMTLFERQIPATDRRPEDGGRTRRPCSTSHCGKLSGLEQAHQPAPGQGLSQGHHHPTT